MIQTILEVQSYLNNLHSRNSAQVGKDMTLQRMWPLLQKVGNPQDSLKVIHIAGTSGKTSTAYYVARLLQQTGSSVGLTVSPHIVSITERLQLNGQPVSTEQFVTLFNQFIAVIGQDVDATYFEFMIVFVLWSFKELGVDYAVVETGLGGMHDGTNVCQRDDKVAVITDIGFDHQHILGDTIALIAQQKAGIIHHGNEVFMYRQAESSDVVERHAQKMQARLNYVDEQATDENSSLPVFQQRNWQLAYAAATYVMSRDHLNSLNPLQLQETKTAVIGRLFEVQADGQLFVLDGAHNQQKMSVLVQSFQEKYGERKIPIVLAIKQDKDYEQVINELLPIVSTAICSEYSVQQDMPVQSVPAEVIAKRFKACGISAQVTYSIEDAINAAIKTNEPLILVTGSLYMIGSALRALDAKL